jgi:hypothetical protein
VSQFENAIDMHKKHREAFNQFSDTFSEATVKEFERQVTVWEKIRPNPTLTRNRLLVSLCYYM